MISGCNTTKQLLCCVCVRCVVLTQVVALVNDINDASYTNMPASLARAYTQTQAQRPLMSKVPLPPVAVPVRPVAGPMTVMSAPSQWAGYRPVAPAPRPVVIQPG